MTVDVDDASSVITTSPFARVVVDAFEALADSGLMEGRLIVDRCEKDERSVSNKIFHRERVHMLRAIDPKSSKKHTSDGQHEKTTVSTKHTLGIPLLPQ